jgi:hypothetical protein
MSDTKQLQAIPTGPERELQIYAQALTGRKPAVPVPRMLRDVSKRDLSVELLGARLPAPILLGPVGVQEIVHDDADVASARAAALLGLPFVLSTMSRAARSKRLRNRRRRWRSRPGGFNCIGGKIPS